MNYVSNIVNLIMEQILNSIMNLLEMIENCNLSIASCWLSVISIFCICFLILKFIFEKNSNFYEYKKPIFQIIINLISVCVFLNLIEKLKIYNDIYNYKNNLENEYFSNLIFIFIVIFILFDQTKNISNIITKIISPTISLVDTSRMDYNLKKNIFDIIKEIITLFIFHFVFSNNLSLIFLIVIILNLKYIDSVFENA